MAADRADLAPRAQDHQAAAPAAQAALGVAHLALAVLDLDRVAAMAQAPAVLMAVAPVALMDLAPRDLAAAPAALGPVVVAQVLAADRAQVLQRGAYSSGTDLPGFYSVGIALLMIVCVYLL